MNRAQLCRIRLRKLTAERKQMIAVIDQMRNALLGVMGLVELIASRDDLPVGLDDLMRLSHRMTEAKAVLAVLEHGSTRAPPASL